MFFYTSQKKQLKEEKQKNQMRVSKSGRKGTLNVTVELRVEFTVLSLSRHFCSYNNSLNIDLYTFFLETSNMLCLSTPIEEFTKI